MDILGSSRARPRIVERRPPTSELEAFDFAHAMLNLRQERQHGQAPRNPFTRPTFEPRRVPERAVVHPRGCRGAHGNTLRINGRNRTTIFQNCPVYAVNGPPHAFAKYPPSEAKSLPSDPEPPKTEPKKANSESKQTTSESRPSLPPYLQYVIAYCQACEYERWSRLFSHERQTEDSRRDDSPRRTRNSPAPNRLAFRHTEHDEPCMDDAEDPWRKLVDERLGDIEKLLELWTQRLED